MCEALRPNLSRHGTDRERTPTNINPTDQSHESSAFPPPHKMTSSRIETTQKTVGRIELSGTERYRLNRIYFCLSEMHDEGSSNKGAVPVKLPSNDELSGHRIPDKMFNAVPTMLFRIVCLSGTTGCSTPSELRASLSHEERGSECRTATASSSRKRTPIPSYEGS